MMVRYLQYRYSRIMALKKREREDFSSIKKIPDGKEFTR
jgi:hypothetical protein